MKRRGYLIVVRETPDADPRIAEKVRESTAWTTIIDGNDLLVAVEDGLPVRREGGCVLLGAVFDGPRNVSVNGLATLTQSVWGAYVAVELGDRGIRVMRDPSGRMPCFCVAWRGWRIFVAQLSDIRALGWQPPGIDWETFGELLQEPRMHDGRTALKAVTELLPGQAADDRGDKWLIWSPSSIARQEIERFEEGRDKVREAVRLSVSAWAGRTPRILHLLSGGLDSSVVLACIFDSGLSERVRCLHFTRGPQSELDEARYAREIAARANVEVVERTFNPRAVLLERAGDLTDGPRPFGYAYSIENDDFEVEAAQAWAADACFSAAGGDGLFYQLQAKIYCADYLRRHGLSPGLLRVAYESAVFIRSSVWSTLRNGFRFAVEGFDPAASPPNAYLADGVGDAAFGWFVRHPWGREAKALAPGKMLHIWALLDSLNFTYDYRRAEFAETILPLVSQPVIEAVLRIPSYRLSCKGVDRTLVREAFQNLLPPSIVRRAGKGSMDGYYAELCGANASLIRERLLGGRLAQQRLLNRARIERALPKDGDLADGAETHLLKLFAAEVWAEAW